MSQQDLLSKVIRAPDESGCAYMLTGSFASSMQGEPRLSHDIDLVVDPGATSTPRTVKDVLGMKLFVSSPEDTMPCVSTKFKVQWTWNTSGSGWKRWQFKTTGRDFSRRPVHSKQELRNAPTSRILSLVFVYILGWNTMEQLHGYPAIFQKLLCVFVPRMSVQILAGSILDNHPVVKHGDTIAKGQCGLYVVSYEKKREALLRLHRLQQVQQLCRGKSIES